MIHSVKHFFVSILFFFGIVFIFAPVPARADGLIPCGKSSGSEAEMAPCTVCHVIVGGSGLIQWGLGIMTVIAITVIFAMAVLYVVSAGNQGLMQTAKGGITAALIGFSVMLLAWLIVNVILLLLVDTSKEPFAGLIKTGAFTFSCDVNSRGNIK